MKGIVGQWQEIEQINIRTLQTAVNIMAGDPEKWTPTNQETADDSMPYTTAVALMFGTVESRHFNEQYLTNNDLLELVSKVNVSVSEEANAMAPEAMLCDLDVITKSGNRHSVQVAYHKGHYKNPLTDLEVEHKFKSLAATHLSPKRIDILLDRLWHLEDVKDVSELLKLTVFDKPSE